MQVVWRKQEQYRDITTIGDKPFDLAVDGFNRYQLAGRHELGVDILFLFL